MGEFLGTYKGVVVNTSDPKSMGRVTLRVPQVLGQTETAWASPSVPVSHLPAPGDSVFVTFEAGDVAYPVYHAVPGTGTGDNGAIPKQPTTLTLRQSAYSGPEGVTLARITVSWLAPTENQDGSVPVSLGGYFVSYSLDDTTWSGELFTSDTSALLDNLPTGVTVYVRAASLSAQGQRLSPYTVATLDTAAAPASPPSGSTLDTALKTANGKNTITVSTNPPGTAANTKGDVWWQKDANEVIIGQWEGLGGTSWLAKTIGDQTIANLNVGKLVAGNLAVGQKIIAGPATDVHAELSDTGFRAYSKDTDGVLHEAVRMGTSTSDLLSLTDGSGNTVASISDSGLISGVGASLAATGNDANGNPNGVTIYGRDFTDWLNSMPWGAVASAKYDQVWSPPDLYNVEIGMGELDFNYIAGRNYMIWVNGVRGAFTTTGPNLFIQRIRYTLDGSAPTTGSPVLDSLMTQSNDTNIHMTPPLIWQGQINATTSGTMRLLVTLGVYAGAGHWQSRYPASTDNSHHPMFIVVNDMGLDVPDVWQYSEGGATYPANSTSTSTTTTKMNYVKTYYSNGWGSYRSINGPVRGTNSSPGDTNGYLYQGYSSSGSYNGDQRGLWTFPNITADVGSGTITKVEAYITANHWYYSAGGTAKIAVHNYLSPPGTLPSMTYEVSSASWPNPGSRWVTLPSSTYGGFANGTWRGFGVGPAGTTDLTYYGYFNAAAQLRVSYTK